MSKKIDDAFDTLEALLKEARPTGSVPMEPKDYLWGDALNDLGRVRNDVESLMEMN